MAVMKKTLKLKVNVVSCLVGLSLLGCSPDTTILETSSLVPADSVAKGTGARPHADVSLEQNIAAARTDLAQRLSVTEADIELLQARSVNWGSSAIGCPATHLNYTQAIVPGTLLLLKANGVVHRYHGREGRDLFYCPKERAKAPAYGQGNELI